MESVIDREDSYKLLLTNADLNSSDSYLSSDLPEAGKTDTDTEDENWNLSNRLQKQSIKTKRKFKVGQRLTEKCVNNETIKKKKNDSKLKRKKPPQKISKNDSVPQEHATRMMQPSPQISNCSKETIDTTTIFRMNAVNEHHIIQSVKEVSEQQAENTSNVSATVVKKN